jgi:hypothetical protein
MRKAEFNVPSEVMVEFAEALENHALTGVIIGKTEDDEIAIEVEYEKSETKFVDEIEETLMELCSQLEEDEEEEDEDDKK